MNGWQQTPNLLGERVRLEPLRHAHAEELASAAADGSLRDTVAFSIIDSEWPAVKLHLKALREAWR